jgi:hypothetical protein
VALAVAKVVRTACQVGARAGKPNASGSPGQLLPDALTASSQERQDAKPGSVLRDMGAERRRRRQVSQGTLNALGGVLRYSASRDAYVLKVVGRRWGPVLKLRL